MRILAICALATLTLLGPVGASARTWYVTPDGSGDAPSIQAAIDSAMAGDTILAGAGTYAGAGNRDISFRGKELVVRSESGPDFTFIACDGSGAQPHRGFKFNNGETTASVLEGFTIQGGYGPSDFSAYYSVGGGIFCSQASPTIMDCVFEGNGAHYGGGVFCHYSAPLLIDCTFLRNTAVWPAGGLYCYLSSPSLYRCVFTENTTGTSGGGMYCYESGPTIDGCVFQRNEAQIFGGGLGCVRLPAPTVTGCTFVENVADLGGALGCQSGASPVVERAVMAFNYGGPAVFCRDERSVPRFSCCDIYGHAAGDWVDFIADQEGANGNLTEDPLFCGGPRRELFLEPRSPCEDGQGCGQIGAYGVGCLPEGVSSPGIFHGSHASIAGRVQSSTWGIIKAHFSSVDGR